jgi:prophage regulatory protein
MRDKDEAVDRLLRLPAIVGPRGLLPISRSSFYAGIKVGVFPKPIRLGKRISVWRLSDLQRAIDAGAR